MRNFVQIAAGVDITPLLHSITTKPHLWNQTPLRTKHNGSPHSQVDDILLRFIDLTPYGELGVDGEYGEEAKAKAQIMDQHESICYPAWFELPQAQPIIFDLIRRVEGIRLGRVIITRLAPGKVVEPHVDSGDHASYYERYHCILQNSPGSIFRAGDESCYMRPGDVWWFNNAALHEVVNNSIEDRITMIVDIARAR